MIIVILRIYNKKIKKTDFIKQNDKDPSACGILIEEKEINYLKLKQKKKILQLGNELEVSRRVYLILCCTN